MKPCGRCWRFVGKVAMIVWADDGDGEYGQSREVETKSDPRNAARLPDPFLGFRGLARDLVAPPYSPATAPHSLEFTTTEDISTPPSSSPDSILSYSILHIHGPCVIKRHSLSLCLL